MLKYIVPNGTASGVWEAGVETQVVGLQNLRSPGLVILSTETATQDILAPHHSPRRAGGQAGSMEPGIGLPDYALGP